MIERLKYINHINEEIDFGKNGLYVNENELHSYAWNFTVDNDKISYFNKKTVSKSIPVIVADSEEGINIVNRLMEVAEKDVLAKKAGRIVVGDYYFKCYITKSVKKKYSAVKGYMNIVLTVSSDEPSWVKESSRSFSKGSGTSGKNLDYPFDMPYDFASPNALGVVTNTSFTDADFELTIFGEVTNPSIFIAGHEYAMNKYIASGQYITINSKEKTIFLTKQNGEKVNCFKDREKESYIFEKIPSGEVTVTWEGDFEFTLKLFEERSEPKWI